VNQSHATPRTIGPDRQAHRDDIELGVHRSEVGRFPKRVLDAAANATFCLWMAGCSSGSDVAASCAMTM
jgi:hypothetical protein